MIVRGQRLCRSAIVAGLWCSVAGWPARADAQAWVPAQGEGSIAIQWQNAFSRYHYVPRTPVDIGHIDTNTLVFDATYGLTNKLAVDLSLPYVAAKYNGPQPHPTALDDGTYHGTMQDFRFGVRYNARAGRFALTPYVGSILPSHSYEYYAHAAPGRRLKELQVGAYVGRLLDSIVPGAFVQARVAYGFMQPVVDISHSRAMLDVELGDFVTERLRVFALGTGQFTRGGIDIPWMGPIGLPATIQPVHDRIDRAHYVNVGGGGSYSLSDSLDMFGSIVTNIANRNGHGTTRGITLGISWTFKRSGALSARDRARAAAETDREAEARALIRCVCQRGGDR
jgi:hypothetical protein